MGTTRHVARRPSRTKLSFLQQQEMWLGPSHGGSAFASDEHRKLMWFRHREKLLQWWGKGGRRPYAWWRYEAPEIEGLGKSGRCPYEHEKSILYDFAPQVLGAEEKAELEREWRKQFERMLEPGFSYHAGSGKVLVGDKARVAYLLWADVPLVLVDRWLAELEQPPEPPAEAAVDGVGEDGPPEAAA